MFYKLWPCNIKIAINLWFHFLGVAYGACHNSGNRNSFCICKETCHSVPGWEQPAMEHAWISAISHSQPRVNAWPQRDKHKKNVLNTPSCIDFNYNFNLKNYFQNVHIYPTMGGMGAGAKGRCGCRFSCQPSKSHTWFHLSNQLILWSVYPFLNEIVLILCRTVRTVWGQKHSGHLRHRWKVSWALAAVYSVHTFKRTST